MKKLILAAISTMFISSAALAERAEKIYGFKVDHTGISYQVISGGCTNESSFAFQVRETSPAQLVLVRTSRLMCEAVPRIVEVHYSWDEVPLGNGDKFIMSNEVVKTFTAGTFQNF